MGLLVVFTLLIIIVNLEQLYDPMSIVRIDLEEEECVGFSSRVKESDFTKEDFDRWRREYMHPLVVGSAGGTLGIFNHEVKRLEDVEGMMREFEREYDLQRIESLKQVRRGGSQNYDSEIEMEDHEGNNTKEDKQEQIDKHNHSN